MKLEDTHIQYYRSPSDWLNDRIIGFYLQHLSEPHSNIHALDPAFIQLIKLADEATASCIISSVDLTSPDLIFAPVNDCTEPEKILGGGHWTFVVWERSTK